MCASSTSTSPRSTRRSTAGCRCSATPGSCSSSCSQRSPRTAGATPRSGAPRAAPSRLRGATTVATIVAPDGGQPASARPRCIGAVNDAAGETGVVVQRGRLDAGRPAQAVARARPGGQGLPRRVRLLVHGLRDPGRRSASSSRHPSGAVYHADRRRVVADAVRASWPPRSRERVPLTVIVLVDNHGYASIGALSRSVGVVPGSGRIYRRP